MFGRIYGREREVIEERKTKNDNEEEREGEREIKRERKAERYMYVLTFFIEGET